MNLINSNPLLLGKNRGQRGQNTPVFDLFSNTPPGENGLNGYMDFTRTSTAYDYDSSLNLQEFDSGVPRFGYSPERVVDGRGLLTHESTTLLDCRYSDDLSNAFWSQQEVVALSETIACPITGRDAYKIIPNGVSTAHSVRDTYVFTSGTNYVAQMIAKADDQRYAFIRSGNNATWNCSNIYDLQTGVSYTLAGGSSGMTPLYDGWYLCWAEAPAVASAGTNREFGVTDSNGSIGSIGDSVKGCYITGVNFFEGNTWKPYTYSNGSNVVVAADVVSTTDLSWFTPDTGVTIYLEADFLTDGSASAFARYLDIYDSGDTTNNIRVYRLNDTTIRVISLISGVVQALIDLPALVGKNKMAISFSSSGFRFTLNGVSTLNTNNNYPTVDTIRIGSSVTGGAYLNARIYDLLAFKWVWSEEQAISRTS